MGRLARVLLPLLLLSAACTRDRFEDFEPAPLTFADRPPIPLDVAQVAIENRTGTSRAPDLETMLPIAPGDATLALLGQRLQARGETGSALAVIDDAWLIEETVGPFGGADVGSDDPPAGSQTRLVGRIKVRVIELDASGARTGSITTAVTHTVGLPPDASAARRRAVGHQLVRSLVDDLDRGLVENAYANLEIVR